MSDPRHWNRAGKPKRWFVTRAEAEDERDQRCPAKDVYPCSIGTGIRHFHIGGRRRTQERLNTRSNGTSRPNRGPSSTTTLDEPHGRNYGRVANGDA